MKNIGRRKRFSGGGRNEREKCFSDKLSSARIPIESLFDRLKADPDVCNVL